MKIPKIEKLPSGSYRCRITIDGRTVSITDTTKEAVEKKAWAYRIGAEKVKACDGSLTLSEAISAYIESRKNTLSPSTIRGYRSIQENRFATLMRKKIADLTPPMCQRAVDAEAREVTAKTLSNSWHLLQAVIKEYGGEDLKPRLPQKIKQERPFLSPDEISLFVEAVKGTDAEIPALLALSSLRSSEVLALTWKSIDLPHMRVRVSGALVKDEDGNLVRKRENKTVASARVVPIFIPELGEALKKEKPKHKDSEPVVTMSHHMLYRRVNKICRELDLPEVGVHGLRHSFASLAYALDVPELVAMQIGGWSDFATMRRIYTHISESQKMKDIDKLTAFFNASKS